MATEYAANPFPRFSDGAGGSGFDEDGPWVFPDDEVEAPRFAASLGAFRTPRITEDASVAITYTASATDSLTVRATFSAAVIDNIALRNPDNYSISPSLTISAITPEAVTNPTYVDIVVNEMKDAESYTLTIYVTLEAA